MSNLAQIELTHANHKKPVYIIVGTICGYYPYKDGSTHIFCTGQTGFPVEETPEEISKMLNKLKRRSK